MASSAVAVAHVASQDDTSLMMSPRAQRQQFTICAQNDEDQSPRAPNPELSRLEATSGLVSLSSQGHENQNRPEDVADSKSTGEKQDINTDVNIPSKDEDDDDLILITDKSTQTDDVLISPLTSDQRNTFSSSSHQNHQDEALRHRSQQRELSENELINDTTDESLEKQSSEAPTLKVEYVGKVWDAYINDFLLGSDHIEQAAIYDIVTGKCIACSSDFTMSQDEVDHLAECLSSLNLAYKVGVTINGRHYRIALADGKRGLMAKGDNRDGCSACRTRTLIIIAIHNRSASGRRCNEELMRLGDFFWSKGL